MLHNQEVCFTPQQRMSDTADKYGMALPPFTSWIQKQQIRTPEADRILPLISQAGPRGISRGEIGRASKLDREDLDEFLDGLVRIGVVQMTDQNGIRVYRTKYPAFTGR